MHIILSYVMESVTVKVNLWKDNLVPVKHLRANII